MFLPLPTATLPFVRVRDLIALVTRYAQLNVRVRPTAAVHSQLNLKLSLVAEQDE